MKIEARAAGGTGGRTAGKTAGQSALPVTMVLAFVLLLWYAAAVWLNAPQIIERFTNLANPWTW